MGNVISGYVGKEGMMDANRNKNTEAVEAWRAIDAGARAWYLGDRPQDPEPPGDVQRALCEAANAIVRAAAEPEAIHPIEMDMARIVPMAEPEAKAEHDGSCPCHDCKHPYESGCEFGTGCDCACHS